ncbi:hypothetical protein FRB90_008967 [Tulasnella sp. 427]|nr:hypothetical protein FRB90_008967 [Tulasnella sp. 427]
MELQTHQETARGLLSPLSVLTLLKPSPVSLPSSSPSSSPPDPPSRYLYSRDTQTAKAREWACCFLGMSRVFISDPISAVVQDQISYYLPFPLHPQSLPSSSSPPSPPSSTMLSSADMTWHHPVSSDRQHDLQLDPYHQQSAHPQQSPVTPHHPQHAPDWDIFASPVAFTDPINGLDVNGGHHAPAVPASATAGNPMREPSYDLFTTTVPNSFGPTGRFRSDSTASSSYNTNPTHPTASPTTGSYNDYLYGQPAGAVSSPSSAHSTRPPSASFTGGYPPTGSGPGTISPDAVGPPSFAELMVDQTSSAPSAGPEYSPYNAFAQPPHQQGLGSAAPGAPGGTRFQMSPYDLASPPQQHQYIQPQHHQQQRPGLPHSSRSMPAVYTNNGTASSATTPGAMPPSPFSTGAFDPSATLAASAPLVKREDVPFNFATSAPAAAPGVPFSTNPLQGDGNDLQSFIRYVSPSHLTLQRVPPQGKSIALICFLSPHHLDGLRPYLSSLILLIGLTPLILFVKSTNGLGGKADEMEDPRDTISASNKDMDPTIRLRPSRIGLPFRLFRFGDRRPPSTTTPAPTPLLMHDVVLARLGPYLERYINSTNRSAAGECSVIVMSSKVAQKSYGTEKRFLCPPPTAVLLGNHWWHETRRGDVIPPKAVISISGEPSPLESLTEWSTPLGKNFDVSDPPAPSTTTYMGRCIGKQLFITDYDDRKKKVEALVRVVQPADEQEAEPERLLGVFPSKPIKVISKPSKKRQSAKNLELCINHGSTVSLFHRLRSQTVSTKYLCVSGSAAAYKGSDGQPLPGIDRSRQTAPPSFIAKTACWDSFVIYIVDVNKQTDPNAVPPPPPHPEYPSPPPNAIPYNTNGAHMYTPIYYNQTVVLQCLISGVVSPVLIIRKVDHGTIAVGGGLADGVKGVPNHYCAPGEVCGDPVSQLHKIALEVYEPAKAGNVATMDPNHPGTSGSFLSCMGERVNTYRPSEDRQWNGNHGGDSSSGTPSPSLPGSPVQSPLSAGANGVPDYFGAMGGSSNASTPGMDYSADGGRVRPSRAQKRGSLNLPTNKGGNGKNRRRVNSASGSRDEEGGKKSTASSGALWSVNIGETAIWTVVGTDQVRYDFYIPPTLYNSPPAGYPLHSQSSSGLASSPSSLNQPITPAPSVVKYLPPERAQELPKCPSNSRASSMKVDQGAASKMLTLYGENFNKGDPVSVWFGSEPSPHTEVRCTEVINCLPPPSGPLSHYPRPVVLVRNDGVVFPTKVMYP